MPVPQCSACSLVGRSAPPRAANSSQLLGLMRRKWGALLFRVFAVLPVSAAPSSLCNAPTRRIAATPRRRPGPGGAFVPRPDGAAPLPKQKSHRHRRSTKGNCSLKW